MGVLVRDPRMQARAEYTGALKEARRKHEELCELLKITGQDVDVTFDLWLKGYDFEVVPYGDNGCALTMRFPNS